MVVAGALVEISGEFHDKLFIRLLKTEEAIASSACLYASYALNNCNRVCDNREILERRRGPERWYVGGGPSTTSSAQSRML